MGALRSASGLGQSARLCYSALNSQQFQVFGIDLTSGLMQPADMLEFEFTDGRHIDGPGTIILHVNAPLVPLALCLLGRRLVNAKYLVAYWAWELQTTPDDWFFGVAYPHEIWVPSQFTADAVRPLFKNDPVRIVPHPLATNRHKMEITRSVAEPVFTVLTICDAASSFARKNPIAAIKAFQLAFGRDPNVRLIIKISNTQAYPSGLTMIKKQVGNHQNIEILEGTMPEREIQALYRNSDVLLSLHRSEGFGLALGEAMLNGLPVIATNWSGNVDFINEKSGWPVSYTLIPAQDPQSTYDHPNLDWAEPDLDSAVEGLRSVYRDAQLASNLGKNGSSFAHDEWSAFQYAKRVRGILGLK